MVPKTAHPNQSIKTPVFNYSKMMRSPILLAVLSTISVALRAADAQDAITSVLPLSNPVTQDTTFDWKPALSQSMRFLLVEHGFRLVMQPKTRQRLGGPFVSDYIDSVTTLSGWGDGDNWFINYVGHPMQGAMSGYIRCRTIAKGATWNSQTISDIGGVG